MTTTSDIGYFEIGDSSIGGFNVGLVPPGPYYNPPAYSQADFLTVLQAYMPRGRVWPRDPGTIQGSVLNGLAAGAARVVGDANDLLQDTFPPLTVDLLPEWQATVGQPDAVGPHPTNADQARQFLVAKLMSDPGQALDAFLGLAAAYGVTMSITECAPFRAGQSRAGQQVGGADWFQAWYITIPSADAAYGPLIAENAPAHTVVNFILT